MSIIEDIDMIETRQDITIVDAHSLGVDISDLEETNEY